MLAFLLCSLQQPSPAPPPAAALAQWPAVAPDGRIAFEHRGDLYLQQAGRAVRLTSGAAIDRQPAWSADGAWLYFTSNRSGNGDLWRVRTSGTQAAEVERVTATAEPELEPATGPGGELVFVRGSYEMADLWVRAADGSERKLVGAPGADRTPSVSRDGVVAYVAIRDGRRTLRTVRLDGTQDRQLLADPPAEFPAWSPMGDRIAFTTTGARRAVLVTNREGAWLSTAALRRGKPAWLPAGDSLLVAEPPPDSPGYNGDPDRVDRDAERDALLGGSLWMIAAPAVPATVAAFALAALPEDSTSLFWLEHAWQRVARTYFERSGMADARTRWLGLLADYRSRAEAAGSQAEVEQLFHEALQRRPTLRPEATGRAGVSSAHPLATEAGVEMLRRGGNVVDAAVAVSFALGVVEPDASGVGGYGEMLIHLRGMDQPALLEFMTRVPEEAGLSNAALAGPDLPRPAVVMVPGTVDAMWRAWQRFGSKTLRWAELLEPAIRLAEQGFVLDEAFPTTLKREQHEYARHESSRALFFKEGRPLAPGDTLRNPDLAWTLRQIAQGGADSFYRGEIARRMVADLRAKGNAMSLRDMARYFAAWREPVTGTYRGHTVYSSAPPVSGGAGLIAQLNMLENFTAPKSPTEDAATAHAMIEAWRLAPRSRIADPSLWPVDLSTALSKDSARARWSCYFDASRVARPPATAPAGTGSREPGTGSPPRCPNSNNAGSDREAEPPGGTTAFAVADGDGNMVAVTQTLGTWGGNFYVTPGLGFLYNDKLGSYGTAPDAFGSRLPFARVGSTITPTLVFKGTGPDRKPLLAAGAAGNNWIGPAVFQIVTGVVDRQLGPQQALELPRFIPSGGASGEGQIDLEWGYSPAVLRRLEQLGHRINLISLPGELRMGYGAAVVIENGKIRAGGDPRRSGAGGAVR